MHIFALETDDEKLKRELLMEGEEQIMSSGYHWVKFIGCFCWSIFITVVTIAALILSWDYSAPYIFNPFSMSIIALLYLWYVFIPAVTSFVDYLYDHIMITNNRIIIIDQASIFTRDIRKMDLENIASVSVKTQWLNMFSFGRIVFDLKEGTGRSITLNYIPHADKVSSCISCCLRDYQARIEMPPPENV